MNMNKNLLPIDYQPTALDVCSGRGKAGWLHEGNVVFRKVIQDNTQLYSTTQSKFEKTFLIETVLDKLRSKGFQFLNKDKASGRWYDIGDTEAREKVAHGLRDQVRSSRQRGNNKRNSAVKKKKRKRLSNLALSKPFIRIENQLPSSVLLGFSPDPFGKRLPMFSNIVSQQQEQQPAITGNPPFSTLEQQILTQHKRLSDGFRRLSTMAAIKELDNIISKEEEIVASQRRSLATKDIGSFLTSPLPTVPLPPLVDIKPLQNGGENALQAARRRSSALYYLKGLAEIAHSLDGETTN